MLIFLNTRNQYLLKKSSVSKYPTIIQTIFKQVCFQSMVSFNVKLRYQYFKYLGNIPEVWKMETLGLSVEGSKAYKSLRGHSPSFNEIVIISWNKVKSYVIVCVNPHPLEFKSYLIRWNKWTGFKNVKIEILQNRFRVFVLIFIIINWQWLDYL